jgi:DNA-binding NtrC family response regulator
LRTQTESFEQERKIAGLLSTETTTSHEAPFAESEEVSEETTKDQVLREAIVRALQRTGGKRKEAAKQLFISERTLYRKIKELDIE